MNQHTTASLNSSIDETIAFREMLEQVLILDIVNFDGHVREAIEQTLLDRQLQHGKHMCDTRLSQRLFATKGEQSIATIRFDIFFWGVRWRLPLRLWFFVERRPFGERLSSDVPADVNVQLTRDLIEERHDENVLISCFGGWRCTTREISYFAALRMRLVSA
jgi:hypothetical protein